MAATTFISFAATAGFYRRIAMNDSTEPHPSIAFFVYPVLRFPRNNREYYLTKELLSRGWRVTWLIPKSGVNEGVPVEDHILRYNDIDIRGRTYWLPLYLGVLLRAKGIRHLWLAGWAIRSTKEIYWLVRILRMFGIETIYDTIDPICDFELANGTFTTSEEALACRRDINEIYGMCSRVLCVTPEIKSLFIQNGIDAAKLFVARWGTDSKLFNRSNIKGDFRSRLHIKESTILVGWFGLMAEFKGLTEMMLPLMEKVSKDINFHFLIAGDGPLYGEIEAWVTSKKNVAITLMGRLPYQEVAEFTASFDVYLVTTDTSSEFAQSICPIKCYDAVAMGTPLITTRTPATEHLLQISENVYLCDYDFNSFEKAIRYVAANIETIRTSRKREITNLISHQSVSPEIADMLEVLVTADEL